MLESGDFSPHLSVGDTSPGGPVPDNRRASPPPPPTPSSNPDPQERQRSFPDMASSPQKEISLGDTRTRAQLRSTSLELVGKESMYWKARAMMEPGPSISVFSLASGSGGNSLLFIAGDHSKGYTSAFLVDQGLSKNKFNNALKSLGITTHTSKDGKPQTGSGFSPLRHIFITHLHSDHARPTYLSTCIDSGINVWVDKEAIEDLPNQKTKHAKSLMSEFAKLEEAGLLHIINKDAPFSEGKLEVNPVSVPHDSVATAYEFNFMGLRIFTSGDMGHFSDAAKEAISRSNIALVDSNYDHETLHASSYSPMIRERIEGPNGHIGNHQLFALAEELADMESSQLKALMLLHRSESNNIEGEEHAAQLMKHWARAVGGGKSYPAVFAVENEPSFLGAIQDKKIFLPVRGEVKAFDSETVGPSVAHGFDMSEFVHRGVPEGLTLSPKTENHITNISWYAPHEIAIIDDPCSLRLRKLAPVTIALRRDTGELSLSFDSSSGSTASENWLRSPFGTKEAFEDFAEDLQDKMNQRGVRTRGWSKPELAFRADRPNSATISFQTGNGDEVQTVLVAKAVDELLNGTTPLRTIGNISTVQDFDNHAVGAIWSVEGLQNLRSVWKSTVLFNPSSKTLYLDYYPQEILNEVQQQQVANLFCSLLENVIESLGGDIIYNEIKASQKLKGAGKVAGAKVKSLENFEPHHLEELTQKLTESTAFTEVLHGYLHKLDSNS